MDVTEFLDIRPAPVVLFDALPARREQVRFMVEDGDAFVPVTWAEFASQVADCTLWLRSSGLGRGDFAAVFADNSVQWLAAALAIEAAGAAMVPIYGNSTAEQVAYVLGHCEAPIVFCDRGAKHQTIVSALSVLDPSVARPAHVIVLQPDPPVSSTPAFTDAPFSRTGPTVSSGTSLSGWTQVRESGAALARENPESLAKSLASISLDDFAVMLYTSGTSGPPKGVPLTHRNIGTNGRDWLLCNGPLVEQGDVDLLWLPFAHIFGFGEACLGNTLGFVSYLCAPLTVLKHMPNVAPNVFMSVPAYVEKIATLAVQSDKPTAQALNELTGGRLRFCLSGGAGLKREVKELLHAHGILVIEGYGLTEAAPTLTLNRPDAYDFDTVGKPLPSVELRLAADGEILARGANIFGGYHKDPEATASAFTPDGWLCTGDLGAMTEDGFLKIVGRKKEILVTASGKNIPPANIETRFADDPHIAHLVVYGDGEKYLTAAVWTAPPAPTGPLFGEADAALTIDNEDGVANVRASITRVNAELPRHETIKRFVVMPGALTVDNGLLTPTLKVRRKLVYGRFSETFAGLYAPIPAVSARV